MKKILSYKNVSFKRDGREILKNINWEIKEGENWALIGLNGSGKSTFLKALARLIKIKQGTISLDEKSLHSWNTKELARHIALLPQITTAPAGMLVEQLVRSGRNPYVSIFKELSDADLAAVEQAMKCTDVWKYRYRQIGELSGGERQRVWLSLSLAQEPNILLLDEPTTYLDSRHQIELMELVKRTQRERNIMVVMVLHDLNLALRYSDRIIAIKEGAIVGDGTPHMMMTPENLADWFGIKADILQSPRSEETCPICVPYGLA